MLLDGLVGFVVLSISIYLYCVVFKQASFTLAAIPKISLHLKLKMI